MTTDDSALIVTPLNMLPIEKAGGTPEEIEGEKQFIRERILGVTNEELMKDEEAIKLLKELGGDLMINAFACNFRIDGKANIDVVSIRNIDKHRVQRDIN